MSTIVELDVLRPLSVPEVFAPILVPLLHPRRKLCPEVGLKPCALGRPPTVVVKFLEAVFSGFGLLPGHKGRVITDVLPLHILKTIYNN